MQRPWWHRVITDGYWFLATRLFRIWAAIAGLLIFLGVAGAFIFTRQTDSVGNPWPIVVAMAGLVFTGSILFLASLWIWIVAHIERWRHQHQRSKPLAKPILHANDRDRYSSPRSSV